MEAPGRFGRYVVRQALGRGGMGSVLRAVDPETGREVAIKTTLSEDAMHIAAIRREAIALSRISHPGVVRVLETGTVQGRPWYAMELLQGRTLRALMSSRLHREGAQGSGTSGPTTVVDSGPTERLSERTSVVVRAAAAAPAPVMRPALSGEELRRSLTVVRRIACPLAYLHGEGFVHRDLKPENVLWREDDHPVLVDFGLSGSFGGGIARESPDVSLEIAGTAAYMAPEQRRGALVDARADLYALGVILYELLAGVPYAPGAPPAGKLVPGVPAEVDRLVARLVAPDPLRRVGHADDVDRDLAELGALGFAIPTPPPRAYLYRPAMEGRQGTFEELHAAVVAAARGRGSVLLLRGESGVGKTRLAMELASDAAARGFDVLVAEHPQSPAPAPLGGFRPLLRRVAPELARVGGANPTSALWTSILSPYEPALAALGCPAPATLPADASRRRLLQAVEEVLRLASRSRALLLLLDDLQWADELTTEALRSLALSGALEAMRVVVVGTMRPEGTFTLPAPAPVREVSLGRLDASAVGRMVARMLGAVRPPTALAADVSAQSGGNPLFVAEYLRLALESGRLFRDRRGRWRLADASAAPLPLPGSVKELLTMRLASLPPEARRLLELASAFGREVPPAILEAAAGLPEEAAAVEVDLLLRHDLVERTPAGLRFAHDKVREIAYDGIAPDDRRRLHGAIAGAVARAAAGDDAAQALLAHQWELAGEEARARDAYLRAARHALGRDARTQAEQAYRAYLRLCPAGDPEVHLELVEKVLAFQSRRKEAMDELEPLLASIPAQDLPLRARAERLLGTSAARRGLYEEGIAWLERACASAAGTPMEAKVLANLADLRRERGDLAEAARLCDAALALCAPGEDEESRTLVLRTLGAVATEQGRTAEARRLLGLAIESYRRHGDRFLLAVCLGNLANQCYVLGSFEEAGVHFRDAIEVHVQTGNGEYEGVARSNHTVLLGTLGRLSEAVAEGTRAIALLSRIDDPRSLALAQEALGETLLAAALWPPDQGSAEAVACGADPGARAQQMLEEARATFRRLQLEHFLPTTLSSIARLHLHRGSPEAARQAAREGLAVLDSWRGSAESDHPLAFRRADLELACGDLDAAAQEIAQALARFRGTDQRASLLGALEIAHRIDVARGETTHREELRSLLRELELPDTSPAARLLAAPA